jgi:hypothetical protein
MLALVAVLKPPDLIGARVMSFGRGLFRHLKLLQAKELNF